MKRCIDHMDLCVTRWMREHGLFAMQIALFIIFFWFGALKLLGKSPATELVTQTVIWWNPAWFIPVLGVWECLIGVCFLHRRLIRAGIILMAFQMVGTFLPLILLPDITFQGNIFFPTLEGQYIIKNLALIAGAILVGSHVRDRQH